MHHTLAHVRIARPPKDDRQELAGYGSPWVLTSGKGRGIRGVLPGRRCPRLPPPRRTRAEPGAARSSVSWHDAGGPGSCAATTRRGGCEEPSSVRTAPSSDGAKWSRPARCRCSVFAGWRGVRARGGTAHRAVRCVVTTHMAPVDTGAIPQDTPDTPDIPDILCRKSSLSRSHSPGALIALVSCRVRCGLCEHRRALPHNR